MANQWFKFFGAEYLGDQKIISLSAAERSCWVTLMCLASNGSGDGVVNFITEPRLMMQSGLIPGTPEYDLSTGIIKKLEMLKMIHIDNEMITLLNWQKRQQSYLSGYERVKRYREKKRESAKKITSEENRIEENRRDKRRKKISATDVASPPKSSKPPKKDPAEPLLLSAYVESMRKSPQRYIRIIGEYADEIAPDFGTRGQWEVFTKRQVRAARMLEVFSDDQIAAAMSRIEKDCRSKKNPKGFITNWGLETLLKYITK